MPRGSSCWELYTDESSPAHVPFWRMWARAVLADQGLLPAPVQAAHLGDPQGLMRAAQAWGLALQQLAECSERVPPRSAEWFAARLEAAAMVRYAGTLAGDGEVAAERAATVVGELLAAVESERLLPHADLGRRVQAERRRGAVRAAKKREENRGRLGWRKRARELDSMMDADSRKERAFIIAQRLGLSQRTVYDALPTRRSRKSSR